MKCPHCGHSNPDARRWCEGCGDALIDRAAETELSPVPASGGPGPEPAEAEGSEQRTPQHWTSPAERLQPSSVLGGRYEILELIGEGGMGRVYKVRDLDLDKVIALKTIRGEDDPELLQRFKQELLLARKITHKNVIRIYDMGEAGGVRFFTMEHIEGESLKDLLRRRGRLPIETAVSIAKQILSALEEAHRQGVVHRDLKPQNIMIDRQGVAIVMDFGIARATDTTGMTAAETMIGTPDYMSPEQARGETATPQSDLFSFGVILFEMLTGGLPYEAETAVSRIMKRLTHDPRRPREANPDMPLYLEQVLLRCMERDQALRYKSTGEILRDLEREQVTGTLTLRVRRAVTRRRSAVAAALIATAAAGVAAYFLAARDGPEGGPQQGPKTTSLAVLPFTNATGSQEFEWLRSGLPEMLVSDIAQSSYVRPVSADRVFNALQQLGIAGQTRFDEAALESISKRVGADAVLVGQFVESGGEIRLDLSLRRTGSGVHVPLKAELPASQIFALVDRLTAQIKEQLDLTPAQLKGDVDRPVAEVSTDSLEALRAYHEGLAQIRQGTSQAAIPLLQEARTADPDFAMAHAKLAEAYLAAGEHREARAAIERARSLSERTPLPLAERYQIHATAAWVNDDYETALENYRQLAALFPQDPDVQLNVARLLAEQGKLEDAVEAYRRVLELAPGYGAALLGLGRVQVAVGQPAAAIESAQAALASGQFEGDPEAEGLIHSILGVAYRETAKLDEAIRHLERSLELRRQAGDRRGQAVTLNNLASVHAIRGEMEAALEAQGRALAIAREMGDRERESNVLFDMGTIRKIAGDLDRALASYRESMQIETERQDHTNLASRLNQIAEIYRLKGQYDDAIVYLEQARTHLAQSGDKRDMEINLSYMGLVRKAQGLYEEALEAYLQALPIAQEIGDHKGVATIQKDLAEIYTDQGRYADALAALRQSLETFDRAHVEHEVAEVKIPLSRLFVILGRLEEAERELSEAQEAARQAHADAVMPEILLARAQLHRARGSYREAQEALERAARAAGGGNRKELAIESRLEKGRLDLERGRLRDAEPLLLAARREAREAGLRSLEARAALALAELRLAQGEPEAARRTSLEAIDLANRFSGRPVLYRAYALLAEAVEELEGAEEALEFRLKAASTLEWIRSSLPPEHSRSFLSRQDVQAFLRETVARLEKGGRGAAAAPLKEWIQEAPTT